MSEHPWIKRGPYPGPEHTGMPIPDDPIVGHTTFRDGHHEPIRQSGAEAIIAESDRAKALRAEQMPNVRAAIEALFSAWLRLKELGWQEAQYCPKDGQLFDVIEPGSTGIHRCRYEGTWPTGGWWIVGDDDLYPSRPVLFRVISDRVGSGTPDPSAERADATRRSEAPSSSSGSPRETQTVDEAREIALQAFDDGELTPTEIIDALLAAVRSEGRETD